VCGGGGGRGATGGLILALDGDGVCGLDPLRAKTA
jgi:hypothetical protein